MQFGVFLVALAGALLFGGVACSSSESGAPTTTDPGAADGSGANGDGGKRTRPRDNARDFGAGQTRDRSTHRQDVCASGRLRTVARIVGHPHGAGAFRGNVGGTCCTAVRAAGESCSIRPAP